MSLQYQIAFLVLVAEIIAFLLLSFPFGRRQIADVVRFVKNHPQLQQLRTVALVIYSLIGLLFLDAVNRAVLQRAVPEVDSKGKVIDPLMDAVRLQKKFLAQRNLYLTGSICVLAWVISSYWSLLTHSLAQDHRLKATGKSSQLEKELEDFRKQVNNLSAEKKHLLEENKKLKATDEGVKPRRSAKDE
jgi:B-cell receptor-associated protein 31